jgi:hypothetical protein
MIHLVRARERHFSDFDWLKTYWLFSFAEYYDPSNIQFGPLRVFNDDVVEPGTGFPTHPHREMEIITIPLSGEITHADSMGNRTVIRAGDVQRMSAGTGLTHSEYNRGQSPVHFYQIWIHPDERGIPPSYDQRQFDPASWRNRLLPVASGRGVPDVVTFHSDVTIYRTDMDRGTELTHLAGENHRVFLYLTHGALVLDQYELGPGDQARIDDAPELRLKAASASGLLLIDLPSNRGFGYDPATLRGTKVT